MTQREYDVVMFGATGFTGQLVAQRLLERAPAGTRIALAGRSLAKLGAVRDSLGEGAAQWPLLLADSDNRATMTKLARSTTAVATTVGPFLRHGLPLVEACARAGTHYADINGEVLFMRAAIDGAHDLAAESGAKIVVACGYDSLPSDLGVLVLHEVAGELARTMLLVKDTRGGASGGTVATMRLVAEAAKSDPAARALLADPYALSPDRDAEPDRSVEGYDSDESDLAHAVHDPELGWLGPFMMGQMNTRVVRRSNALLGYPYSDQFRYRESIAFGEGVGARAKATGLGAGMGALGAALGFGPTRSGIGMVLPKPGEGPSAEERAAGRFTMEIHGWTPADAHYVATVSAQGDPGYAVTSLMLAESVLFLASGSPDLPEGAGVLTPATALGLPMVDRLRAAGMTFEAGPWVAPESAPGGEDVAEADEHTDDSSG